MTSILLNSTENSATVQVVNDSTKADLSYEVKPPLPELFVGTPLKVQPYSAPSTLENNYITYQIPKEGCFQDSMIELRFSIIAGVNGADDNFFLDDGWSGLELIDRIELRTSSITLQTFHGESMRARVKNMPLNKKISVLKNAALRTVAGDALVAHDTKVPAGASAGYSVSIPIFNFMTEQGNMLEALRCYLPKVEQLYIYVHFRPLVSMRFNADALITSVPYVSAYLYMNRLTMSQKTTNEIVSKNSTASADQSKGIIMAYDYQRFTKALDTVTTTTFTHTITQAIRRTWIFLQPITGAGSSDLCNIDTITIDLNGTKLIDAEKRRMINYNSEVGDNCLLTIKPYTATPDALILDKFTPVCIDWCKFPEMYNLFSGVVSFSQIPNVGITITYPTVTTATNYNMVVVHETVSTISLTEQGYFVLTSMT